MNFEREPGTLHTPLAVLLSLYLLLLVLPPRPVMSDAENDPVTPGPLVTRATENESRNKRKGKTGKVNPKRKSALGT